MNNLHNVKLRDILPPSIKHDEKILALCECLDNTLSVITKGAHSVLLLPRIETLEEKFLDELAWQYHVDAYDESFSITQKRELIRNAISLHYYRGTVSAVEETLTKLFRSAVVMENWEYAGEPYHFKVKIQLAGEEVPTDTEMALLAQTINSVKNVRSWFDGFEFTRNALGTVYYGGIVQIKRKVSI